MNTKRIHSVWVLALLVNAFPLRAEVGEFHISDDLIQQIELISVQTAPFTKKGRQVRPNIQVKVTPTLLENSNELSMRLGFQLQGSSQSKSFTPVRGSKGVTAVVNANVKAYFEQDLSFDGNELRTGDFNGKTEITPQGISVSNNFGLLNGVVNRQAQKKARSQVQAELPQEKRDLEEMIQKEIEKGLTTAREQMRSTTAQLNQVFSRTEQIPFDSRFSTQKGRQGGMNLQFTDKGESPSRGPKPEFNLSDQIATSGVFHEDLLTKMIAPQIAGKEMKITELRAYLCSEAVQGLLNFCESEMPVGGVGLSVILDAKDPISFKFQDGKVKIKINAKNRVGLLPGNQVPTGLFAQAGGPNRFGQLDFEPYQVEISYQLNDGSATLEDIKVKGLNTPAKDLPNNKPAPNGDHQNTLAGTWRRIQERATQLMDDATESTLEREYRRIMKDKIEFPIVSFPVKAKADPAKPNERIEIIEAGTLLPLEVKAENGWLAVSASLCTENMKALGITFDSKNRIQTIQPGSPAAKVGFKVGDRIESFGSEDQRATAIGADIQPFLNFIKEKALHKGTQQRMIELAGKTEAGIPFKRSVSLCPSQLKHREEAAKFLSKVP